MTNRHVVSKRWARVALIMAMTSIAAACTSQESSDPGSTLTSVATTTSTTLPPTTSAPTPTTTAPPDTTTTATPTTTAAPPSGPVDGFIPLLTGGESGNWLFLGAWQADHWMSALDDGTPITPSIDGEPTFAITGLGFPKLSGVVGPNGEACFDGSEGPSIDAAVPPPEPPGFGYNAIALPTSWPLKPRPVAQVAGGVPAYQQIGEDAFAGEPVDASLGEVEQIVIADLDGDGDDEAIVGFEYVQDPASPGSPGDLAAILLVDTASRSAQTIISANVAFDAGDDADFFAIIDRYRVLDVADLNGDGRMEVAIHAWYYEGASVILYEYDGTGLTQVLATGCGA
jgi:hypothetical protein